MDQPVWQQMLMRVVLEGWAHAQIGRTNPSSRQAIRSDFTRIAV